MSHEYHISTVYFIFENNNSLVPISEGEISKEMLEFLRDNGEVFFSYNENNSDQIWDLIRINGALVRIKMNILADEYEIAEITSWDDEKERIKMQIYDDRLSEHLSEDDVLEELFSHREYQASTKAYPSSESLGRYFKVSFGKLETVENNALENYVETRDSEEWDVVIRFSGKKNDYFKL